MALKEDSFKDPQEGMSPEQWMMMPYRKRRYITLRNRARTGDTTEPKPVAPTASTKVLPADPEAPEAELPADEPELPDDDEVDDTDDTTADTGAPEEPESDPESNEPVGEEFIDAVVNFVTNTPGVNRAQVAEFIGQNYGDRLNTQAQVNNVIRQAVQNGDIEFNEQDVAFIPGTPTAPEKEPTAAELDPVEKAAADKKSERERLIKKFLKWRSTRPAQGAERAAKEISGDDDEGEDDSSEEDDDMKDADKVLKKRSVGSRLSHSGIEDPEAVDVESN